MNRAEVLAEALPYIEEFRGAYVVLKYGGHAMLDEEAMDWTIKDTILLKYVGMKPVVVHGGGPEISKAMEKMGKKPQFIEGLRVTDEETMDIVKMVLVGKINTEIVSRFNAVGGMGVGLSGKDGQLIMARKKAPQKVLRAGVEREVDLGLVGETEQINPKILEILTAQDYVPVIAPIGLTKDGKSLNLNADTVAGDVALALRAKKLIVLTDVPGVLRDLKDEGSLLRTIRSGEMDELLREGVIEGSMIPKLKACAKAVEGGVEKTHIIDGRVKHSILLELFTDEGIGTMVLRD
ncbi:MAG: acetylglutamate kinase [Euryarchaeota archaeon]|nr:acetylglutamate kinase [Euryarchaeota archaeon]